MTDDTRNVGLEQRISGLGEAMVSLAEVVDENLRTVLLAMTTEEAVTSSLELKHTTPYQGQVMESALTLLALEGPVASDLRWAMAMMRLAKDYERIADLARNLMRRVESLTDSLHEETLHAMTGVTRAILRLHAILLEPARPEFRLPAIDWAAHKDACHEVSVGLEVIEQRSVDALLRGEGTPESLRELVLAARHLQRIAGQLERMPRELERFGGA